MPFLLNAGQTILRQPDMGNVHGEMESSEDWYADRRETKQE
jgi:hypothetical protein